MRTLPLLAELVLFSSLFWALLVVGVSAVVAVGWLLTSVSRTLFDLWWALRPLLIPLVGIGLVASFARWWLAVPAVLVSIGLLVWLLMRKWQSATTSKRGTQVVRDAFAKTGAAAALVLVGLFGFFVLATGESSFVDEYDFWSRRLVELGFSLWGVVLLLRLWAFAVTPMRRFVAVLFLAAYVRYYVGLFVAGDVALTIADHGVWGLLTVAVLVWLVVVESPDKQPAPDQNTFRAHTWGLGAAFLSALAFALAGFAGMFSDPPVEEADMPYVEREVRESSKLAQPDVSGMIASHRDGRLAREFSPLLQFSDGQRWRPIAVDRYLADADLRGGGKVLMPRPLAVADLRRKCAAEGSRLCYALTVRCPIERADIEGCEGATKPLKGYAVGGTAYVRFVDDPTELAHGPYADELKLLVQYWLFYYYDDWRARTLFGELRQAHEADWEVVSVGFSDRSPLFVALSAHCGGTWLRWDRARVAQLHGDRYHPIVGVAEGSQANYHEPRASVPPDNWARCAGIPSNEVSALSLAYRIRDRTGVHGTLELANLPVVREDDPIMTFPGVWGRHGVAHFYTAFKRRYDLEEPHNGPKSPRHQPTWSSPVKTIFCSDGGTWRRVAGGPKMAKEGCKTPARSTVATSAGS